MTNDAIEKLRTDIKIYTQDHDRMIAHIQDNLETLNNLTYDISSDRRRS